MAITRASWRARISAASTLPPTSVSQTNSTPSASSRATRRSMIHFSSFASGTPKRSRPPGRLVALVDRDAVAELVQLSGHGQARGARAHHSDGRARARLRRVGVDPALVEAARDDGQLDLLDGDRVAVDVEHARGLARRGTDEAGELREVVRRVQLNQGVLPAVLVDEVVPVRDLVPQRAALVAEGHAAVHAAPALLAQRLVVRQLEVLLVVVHPLARLALLEADALDAHEAALLAHG